jgi:hypothetical protein
LSIFGKDRSEKAAPKSTPPAGQKVPVVRRVLKSKNFWSSLILLVLGYTCLFLENTSYQYFDENGVLHESFFLPLGCLSLIFGGVGLLITAMIFIWNYSKLGTSRGTP